MPSVMSNVLVNNEHFVDQHFSKTNWHATISLNLSRYLELFLMFPCISCYAVVETPAFDGGLEDSVIHSVLFAVARFVVGET